MRGIILMALSNEDGHLVLDDRQQERARDRLLDALRRQRRRLRADQGRAEDAGLGAGALAQRRGACDAARSSRSRSRSSTSRRRPSSRPGSSTGPAPAVRRARRRARRLRRARPRPGRAARAGFDAELVERVIRLVDRRRVQAPAVPAGPEDLPAQLRPRPPAADHVSVARARRPPRPRAAGVPPRFAELIMSGSVRPASVSR